MKNSLPLNKILLKTGIKEHSNEERIRLKADKSQETIIIVNKGKPSPDNLLKCFSSRQRSHKEPNKFYG